MPVHTNVLWATADEARSAPRADIALSLCTSCGLIWNTQFDQSVLSYDAEYENSLHFSDAFRRYSDELIDRLIARHRLKGKHVAEIGSGKGEFLTALCARGGCTGVGFDPSYAGESDSALDGRVRFVRDLLGPGSELGSPALILSRHVLEHVEDPIGLLAGVREALGDEDAAVYVEVPAAEYLLDRDAVWDVIYPHVTCLLAPVLRKILVRAGFEPVGYGYSFGGQYLWVEAKTSLSADAADEASAPAPGEAVSRFAARFTEKRADWAVRLPRLLEAGDVAVWGAGAKAATFLNLLDPDGAIRYVVDVNPRKHGKHIPGTGQRIIEPADLTGGGIRTVIVMNPIYGEEITAALRKHSLDVALIVA